MSDCVTIRCNNCGEDWVFHPQTIKHQPECDCGNKDSGNCLRDWPQNKFGNFTLIERKDVTYTFPDPFYQA